MQNEIRRYQVQHPLLKNYIKFFWELYIENAQLNLKIIPQRNINLRFNLNETGHSVCSNAMDHLLEDVYFSGLQDHFKNSHLKLNGKVDVPRVCFSPNGFYFFLKSLFQNSKINRREPGKLGLSWQIQLAND